MDQFSAALAIKALDGLSMRAEVTTSNIANAGSPNFRPLTVSFEDALRGAAKSGVDAIQGVAPRTGRATGGILGSDLRLDRELATASTTAMRYAALIEVLNRRLQIERIAVSGGQS